MVDTPSLQAIEQLRRALERHIAVTPTHHWRGPEIAAAVAPATEVYLKLELFQVTGTFKPRGALAVMLDLDPAALGRGVTAVSAGNHAIAVAYSAQILGSSAKVVMPKTANPMRVSRCREYGAEVVLTNDIAEAFAEVERIEREEGRAFVHPFEGPRTALGTATLGVELVEQAAALGADTLDAVIVPIGGGGLCAGVAAAIKQLTPGCRVIGVEPEGACSMSLSFAAGSPQSIAAVRTIADSLGAPYAAPHSFALCQRFVDEIVLVDDDQLRRGMAFLYHNLKIAVEPAGAAATAALLGPAKEQLEGKRVGLIVCGSNIDIDTFHDCVKTAQPDA